MGRTVVVGGGTSGLAAGFTLERAGADYLVVEKRDFSGGRIYGVVKEGFTLDLGAQFFFSRYHSTFALMEKLGIADQLVKFSKPLGILRDGTVHVINPDIKNNLAHPVRAIRFKALSSRGKRQAIKMAVRLVATGKKLDFDDPVKAIELDGVSFAEYARRNFGEELLEYFIQPVASTLTLGEPEEISAAYGLGLAWYFLPGLSTTARGIGLLADSLASAVSNLNLNTAARKIVIEDGRVKGVEIEGPGGKETIEADSVICTAIAGEAADLLPGLPVSVTDTLRDVRYSACAHVMFAIPRKVLGDVFAVATPRREGLCISGFIENANKASGYAPPNAGIMHAFTFGEYARQMITMDDDEIQKRVTQDIQMVVPRFPDAPIFCEIFRWPQAVCLSSPGHITAMRRIAPALGEYRGLHLAGEYLGMPSVEAAIDSGVRAAENVLKG